MNIKIKYKVFFNPLIEIDDYMKVWSEAMKLEDTNISKVPEER